MIKIAKANIYKIEDKCEGETEHNVYINGENVFNAYDLDECPEDAIIGRDLFDGYDFIEAVKYGMELAREGYTDIEIEVSLLEE